MNQLLPFGFLEAGIALILSVSVFGQSSSLLVTSPKTVAQNQSLIATPVVQNTQPRVSKLPNFSTTTARENRTQDPLIPAIRNASFITVGLPDPRRFELQDLITILVREETQASSGSKLDTNKELTFEGEIKDLTDIKRLFTEFTLSNMGYNDDGPRMGLEWSDEFKGDGSYERRDTLTSRIQARIIDIKPNGLLVLQARKFISSDRESMQLTLTGTCRPEDVTADNAILSTQLYDLHLNKQHAGDVRDAARKGIFTRILETVFNF